MSGDSVLRPDWGGADFPRRGARRSAEPAESEDPASAKRRGEQGGDAPAPQATSSSSPRIPSSGGSYGATPSGGYGTREPSSRIPSADTSSTGTFPAASDGGYFARESPWRIPSASSTGTFPAASSGGFAPREPSSRIPPADASSTGTFPAASSGGFAPREPSSGSGNAFTGTHYAAPAYGGPPGGSFVGMPSGPLIVETSTFPIVPGWEPDTGQLLIDRLDKGEPDPDESAAKQPRFSLKRVKISKPAGVKSARLPSGWIRQAVIVLLAVVVAVGASYAIGRWMPTTTPQPAPQQVSSHLDMSCPAAGDMSGTLTGAASNAVQWTSTQGVPSEVEGPVFQRSAVSGASVLSGDGALAGSMQYTRDGASAVVACAQPLATGFLQANTANATLVLTNIDDADAIINVSLLGPDGEIDASGLIDLTVAAGSTTSVALGDYASGVVPLGITWQSTVGRVVAWVLVDSDAAGLDLISPTKAESDVVVPAVPGDATVNLVLTNPSITRAKATVQALTDQGALTVVGGEQVAVEARTTMSLDLTAALQGQTVALRIHSDQPIAVTAVVQAGTDAASSPGVPASQLVRPDLLGAISGPGQLVIANNGISSAQATVTIMASSGDPSVQPVNLAAGTSTVINVAAGARSIQVHATPGVVASVVLRPGGDIANGTSVVRLGPDPAWSGVTPLWVEAQPIANR